jgi:hypothetical protein
MPQGGRVPRSLLKKMNKKYMKYKDVIIEVDVKCAGDTNSYWKEITLYAYVPRRILSQHFKAEIAKDVPSGNSRHIH